MKTVRADLCSKSIIEEEFLPSDWDCPGGAGLVTEYLLKRCGGTSPEDCPVVLATGAFAGTRLASSGILTLGWIDPAGKLRLWVSGGNIASRLTDHGIKLLALEGVSDDWTYLHTDGNGKMSFRDANSLAGRGTLRLTQRLRDIHAQRSGIMCVGPWGENLGKLSSVMVTGIDPSLPPMQAAGGGLGEAFGGKKLLAVVTDHGDDPFRIAFSASDGERFDELCSVINSAVSADPSAGTSLPMYGPGTGLPSSSGWNDLYTESSSGGLSRQREDWRERLLASGGYCAVPCMPGCTVRCSNLTGKRSGQFVSGALDQTSVSLFGAGTGIFDLSRIVKLDGLCTDMGCDFDGMGRLMGELCVRGILPFGDYSGMQKLIRTPLPEEEPLRSLLLDGTGEEPPAEGYEKGIKRGRELREDTDRGEMLFACGCFMCVFVWRAVMKDAAAREALAQMMGLMGIRAEDPLKLQERILGMKNELEKRFGAK